MSDQAITAAIAPAIEPDEEPEQLALFGQPLTAEGLALAQVLGRRSPGRPPGARNRRTERTIAFLLARHRDPREVLLEIAEANVYDLARLLGCKPYEALQEKRLAAIGVLPYLAARITPEVVDNRQVINLRIGSFGAEPGAGAGLQLVEGTIEVLEQPAIDQPAAEHPSAETPDEAEA